MIGLPARAPPGRCVAAAAPIPVAVPFTPRPGQRSNRTVATVARRTQAVSAAVSPCSADSAAADGQ